MPVIQLPRDDRWGEIGRSLGGAATSLVQAWQDKQVSEGVAQVMQDPAVSELERPSAILKKFGQPGLIKYGDMLKTQQQSAQIKHLLAESKLTDLTTQAKEAQQPYVGPQAAATVASTEAGTREKTATAAEKELLTPGAARAQAATTALTEENTRVAQERVPLVAAEAQKTDTEAQILATQLKQYKQQLAAPGGYSALDDTLDRMGIPKDDPTREIAKQAYLGERDPTKASEKFIGVVEKYNSARTSANIRASEPKQTPEPQIKFSTMAIEKATSAKRFMDNFKKGGAEELGLTKGGAIKVMGERLGLSSGDQTVVDMWNAAMQQVSSEATGSGGFFAMGRVTLAKQTTPGINETPLHALLAADQVADRMIAALEVQKAGLAPSQSSKPIDLALDKWRGVKQDTSSLSSYVVQKPGQQPRNVVLFDGNQVDIKSFKKIFVGGPKEYDVGRGQHVTGAKVLANAQEANMIPDEFLAATKAYYETR